MIQFAERELTFFLGLFILLVTALMKSNVILWLFFSVIYHFFLMTAGIEKYCL